MKPNGTQRKLLTNNPAYATSPAYSPDGKKIAFVGQGEDEDILVMNAKDGTNQKDLTNTPPVDGYEVRERGPAYSPDGTKIVFTRDGHVYQVNPDGTSEREVPGTPKKNGLSEVLPDWGPKRVNTK
jgi:TolB protein